MFKYQEHLNLLKQIIVSDTTQIKQKAEKETKNIM